MKRYLLIKPDEDGNPTIFLNENALQELLDDPIGVAGVEEFLSDFPGKGGEDPQYWKEGQAMLLEIKVLNPKSVTSKYVL